jgi:hypothetical protein
MSTTAIREASFYQTRCKDERYYSERVTVSMDIVVDWEAVATLMARKVVANKSGKSKALQGAVTAIRRKVERKEV